MEIECEKVQMEFQFSFRSPNYIGHFIFVLNQCDPNSIASTMYYIHRLGAQCMKASAFKMRLRLAE